MTEEQLLTALKDELMDFYGSLTDSDMPYKIIGIVLSACKRIPNGKLSIEVNNNWKELRLKTGLKQKEVAEKVGKIP